MPQVTIKREEEEGIIKRKLFYDGHGTGEDKKLVWLIKSITKFCLVDYQKIDFNKLHTTISNDLALAINATERQLQVSNRCDKTIPYLEAAIAEEQSRLSEIRSQLADLEQEQNYVEQLRQISVYPDCSTTGAAIKQLQDKRDKLMEKLHLCRNHIKTILESCENMRPIIDDTPIATRT